MARTWRQWLRALHRDLGYVAVGLTVIYAISGLAVNHVADWNPNRTVTTTDVAIGPLPGDTPAERRAIAVTRLDLDPADVRSELQQGPGNLKVFFVSGSELRVDPTTGKGRLQRVGDRPILRAFNALHLNDLKGFWTWMADAYAIALLFLACSGLFMLRGTQGLAGRGKWLVAVGALIPAVALAIGSW